MITVRTVPNHGCEFGVNRIVIDYFPKCQKSVTMPIITAEIELIPESQFGTILSIFVRDEWKARGFERKFLRLISGKWSGLHFDLDRSDIGEFIDSVLKSASQRSHNLLPIVRTESHEPTRTNDTRF